MGFKPWTRPGNQKGNQKLLASGDRMTHLILPIQGFKHGIQTLDQIRISNTEFPYLNEGTSSFFSLRVSRFYAT